MFIDSASSNEDNVSFQKTMAPRNIIAFDDAVVDIGDCGSESTNSVDEEDNQSRSSSTDLNNFLKIKEVIILTIFIRKLLKAHHLISEIGTV